MPFARIDRAGLFGQEIAAPTERERSAAAELSIVAPAYDEEGNVEHFFEALEPVLRDLGLSWELIVVDDGSRDGTWSRVRSLHARDERVRGVRLSRNFGHQYALLAGLCRAHGQAVVSMDADLWNREGRVSGASKPRRSWARPASGGAAP